MYYGDMEKRPIYKRSRFYKAGDLSIEDYGDSGYGGVEYLDNIPSEHHLPHRRQWWRIFQKHPARPKKVTQTLAEFCKNKCCISEECARLNGGT